MTTGTDWDQYYSKLACFAGFTRSITRSRLIGCLRPHMKTDSVLICEYGGANSCIAESLCGTFSVSQYDVVDTNVYGLSLLKQLDVKAPLSGKEGDVLAPSEEMRDMYDVVVSIGLIEHFAEDDTRRAVETHFYSCKPGGLVLLTFPTPTLLYRFIRRCAETGGFWNFPDEYPLHFDEVLANVATHGDVLHQSINWMIGLTQGIVLVRKR